MDQQQKDIQSLNMTNNRIQQLERGIFYNINFTNIQKIYLANNQLEHIEEGAFYRLIGLVELDVSSNLLRRLPKNGTFLDCLQLRLANFAQNKLTSVPAYAFRPLHNLRQLSLAS